MVNSLKLLIAMIFVVLSCVEGNKDNNHSYHEYIITLNKAEMNVNKLKLILNIYNIKSITKIGYRTYLIKVDNDPGLQAIQRFVSSNKEIKHVEINKKIKLIDPVSGIGKPIKR